MLKHVEAVGRASTSGPPGTTVNLDSPFSPFSFSKPVIIFAIGKRVNHTKLGATDATTIVLVEQTYLVFHEILGTLLRVTTFVLVRDLVQVASQSQ